MDPSHLTPPLNLGHGPGALDVDLVTRRITVNFLLLLSFLLVEITGACLRSDLSTRTQRIHPRCPFSG